MLSLEAPTRTVAGVDLAGDDRDPYAFHALPPSPRVAIRDGSPKIHLFRIVRDGALEGGHIELGVELAHPEGALAAARDELAAEISPDHPERVTLRPVTAVVGSAELCFVGRETDADGGVSALLRRRLAAITPALDAPHAATFSVPLTPEGVALVEAALRSGASPIGVVYRLQVEALRPAHRIRAHVDWARVYEHLSSHFKQGYLFSVDDIQRVTESLVETRAVTVDVVQALVPEETEDADAGPSADELGPALEWIQREIVERCCEPAMELSRAPAHASLGTAGEMFGVGSKYVVKAITQIERVTADIDLERAVVVSRTLCVQTHLADLVGGAEAISDVGVDHPFFARASLHLTTARPLSAAFVREVVARFAYGPTEIPIRLTADAPEGQAETWADQSQDRTWSLALDITLAEDAPIDPGAEVRIPPITGTSRALALDLEQCLGLRAIDLLSAADPRIAATRVEVRHLRGDDLQRDPSTATLIAEAPLTASAEPPLALRATVWLRDVRPGDRLLADVRYLLADGRILDIPPLPVDTRLFRLPPPFPGAMTVELIASDDFEGIDRVVVSLQKRDDLPAGAIVLDRPGARAAVRLDLPDPTDRSYRYKVARTLSGGAVEEDDWITTDRPVLLVGRVAANALVVDVTPLGLELPEAGISLIEVELQYVDAPNQVLDRTTAVIRARADTFRWTVALKDPTQRKYEYRITTYRSSGEKQVGRWTASTDRILPVPITKP